jgi:alkaline phosphatase D
MPDPKRYLVLGPIIGGLSHRSVRLWGRASGRSIMRAWLARSEDLSDSAVFGEIELCSDTGFTGTVDISGLEPGQKYFYALSLDSGGRPHAAEFSSFKTFPRPGEIQPLRFAFGSCFLPGKKDPGRAFRQILENHPSLDLLIMEGDQIYSDEPKFTGLEHIALTLEDYRKVYLKTWSNPWHRELLRGTPVFMMMDDHEVDNDWHWQDPQLSRGHIPFYTRLLRWISGWDVGQRSLTAERIQAALQAYNEHQGSHAPSLTIPAPASSRGIRLKDKPAGKSLAYTFYFGAAAFFVMDTRTERVHGREQCVLSPEQWSRLEEWLLAVNDLFPVKFLVTSSAILFEMFGDFAQDRWVSFPRERDRLLHFLAASGITGVYFLSGDLHEAHAVSTELYGPNEHSIPLWEFSATPFEQQPNALAKFVKRRARSSALHNTKIHYTISRINYGVVEVSFEDPACPRVDFELHYEDKGEWKKRRISTQVEPLR